MIRSSVATAFLFAVTGITGCAHPTVQNRDPVGSMNDTAEIYKTFLVSWVGDAKKPLNVSMTAKKPTSDEIKDFTDCTKEGDRLVQWIPAYPIRDLTGSIGELPYVHLVDSEKWEAHDPGDLIAQGKSVESAVESGFSHGLMTLSAITFDAPHENAAFTYGFVCGGLCGNGGTVIFKKVQSHWARSEKSCGIWMS